MIAYQFSIMENEYVYTFKCASCNKTFQTKNKTDDTCPSCSAGLKLRKHAEFDESLIPTRKDLTADEFAVCVGRLVNAMIGNASEDIAKGNKQERKEAVFFLKGGGIDDWIHLVGLEVSRPLRQMIDKAAEGKPLES